MAGESRVDLGRPRSNRVWLYAKLACGLGARRKTRDARQATETNRTVHRAVPRRARLERGSVKGLRPRVQGRGEEKEGGRSRARGRHTPALEISGAARRPGHLGGAGR